MFKLAKLLAVGLMAAGVSIAVHAQAAAVVTPFPTRPVRILTPFPAGAGPEAVLRVLAEKLQKKWGQPVIVENEPGANGFLPIDAFKRGDTSGRDLIQLDNVHLVAYPYLFRKLPYDPAKDFDVGIESRKYEGVIKRATVSLD